MDVSPKVMNFLQLALIAYGSLAAPTLPPSVAVYFRKAPVRVLVMVLAAYLYNRDPVAALVIGVSIFAVTTYLESRAAQEGSTSVPVSTTSNKTRGILMDINGTLSAVEPLNNVTGIQKATIMNAKSNNNQVKSTITLNVDPSKYQMPITWSIGQAVVARGLYYDDAPGINTIPAYMENMYAAYSGYLRLGTATYK